MPKTASRLPHLDLGLVRKASVYLLVLIAETGGLGAVPGVLGAVVLLDVPTLPAKDERPVSGA